MFAKLGDKGPRPPRRAAPPRPGAPPAHESPRTFSLSNVLILSLILSASVAFYWQTHRGAEEPARDIDPAPPPRTDGEPGASVAPREIEVEVPAPPSPGTLAIPGFQPRPAPAAEETPAQEDRAIPDLPQLDEHSVTPALIERAKGVAQEFPSEPSLREYLAAAHLILAGKEMKARRFQEALNLVDEAEQWGADSGQTATFRAIAYGELQSWELAERWAETALGYGARANEADMHHILGKAYYFREEMDKAIEEFEKALELRDDPNIRASLERARLEARTARGFDQKKLSHFIVSYEGETMESTGRMVLDALERSRASLVSQFGFEPEEPIVVILYSRTSYREMGGPHWSAGLFDGKIRIPVGGLSQVDEQIRGTLHHELVHAFIHARAGDRAPRWLHEGIAEYMEGTRAAQLGNFLAQALADGNTFEHCLPTAQCDVRVFYAAAVSLVDYIIQMRGVGGIRDILSALGEGDDIDASLRKVLGKDEGTLIREWEHFVSRRYTGR
ncbi:MAG TPA: basic secretory protein-like protein [Vicinamibacteria bacterium]